MHWILWQLFHILKWYCKKTFPEAFWNLTYEYGHICQHPSRLTTKLTVCDYHMSRAMVLLGQLSQLCHYKASGPVTVQETCNCRSGICSKRNTISCKAQAWTEYFAMESCSGANRYTTLSRVKKKLKNRLSEMSEGYKTQLPEKWKPQHAWSKKSGNIGAPRACLQGKQWWCQIKAQK